MAKRRLVLAGIVGRYPVGGVTWCALHYIAGFQRLGYEVFYLEDTGECGFDPVTNGVSKDPSYALRYIRRHLDMTGLADSWAYIDYKGGYHGKTREQVQRVCRDADLMVNLSGGCWFARPEYEHARKIFIDTDPGFTQKAIADAGPGWYRDFLAGYDAHFTFALNVDSPDCALAPTPFDWKPTLQPLATEFWPDVPAPQDAPYTAILSWKTASFSGLGAGKAGHLVRMIDLPARCPRSVLLAIAGQAPTDLLKRHGWNVTDAVAATIDADEYRSFIQSSRAEIGFAKPMYVTTRSGWVSDRTQCYLASGRPALVHDTGFGRHIPTGEGLLTYENVDDLLNGIDVVESDYGSHRRRAREIAREHFDAERVLTKLLQVAGMS